MSFHSRFSVVRGMKLIPLLLLCGAAGVANAANTQTGTQLYAPITTAEPSGLTKFEKKLPKPNKLRDKDKDKDKDKDTNKDIDPRTHLPLNPVAGGALPHPANSDLPWEPSR